MFYVNDSQKKTRVMMLISDSVHFRAKSIARDKEGHLIIKG